jgi:hypothetical protein
MRLDLPLTWPGQMGIFIRPGVGVIALRMRGARNVALFRCLERQEGVDDLRMRLRIGPV